MPRFQDGEDNFLGRKKHPKKLFFTGINQLFLHWNRRFYCW